MIDLATTLLAACLATAGAQTLETVHAGAAASFGELSGLRAGALRSPQRPRAAIQPQSALLGLLRDADPAIRARAARSLRAYVSDFAVEGALLRTLADGAEDASVRREAARSLAPAGGRWNVQRALLDAARGVREPALKALCWKALYLAGQAGFSIRRALLDALDSGPAEERAAAAWALGASSADSQARTALIATAKDRGAPEPLRLEAARSLAGAVSLWDARDALVALAKDARSLETLRAEAALALVGALGDWSVQALLEELARRDASLAVRQAATRALGGWTLELALHFHLSQHGGRPLDPLALE
ncbi:MAG: hypothetical protein HY554_15410 [Elusimicrobia bacterium]|nr:hypothetical protein [Elusimicrobiota bacterium]